MTSVHRRNETTRIYIISFIRKYLTINMCICYKKKMRLEKKSSLSRNVRYQLIATKTNICIYRKKNHSEIKSSHRTESKRWKNALIKKSQNFHFLKCFFFLFRDFFFWLLLLYFRYRTQFVIAYMFFAFPKRSASRLDVTRRQTGNETTPGV